MNGLRYRKIRNIEELEAVRAGTQPRTSVTQSIVWRRRWAYKIKKKEKKGGGRGGAGRKKEKKRKEKKVAVDNTS